MTAANDSGDAVVKGSARSDEDEVKMRRTEKWEITTECLPYKELLALDSTKGRSNVFAVTVDDGIGDDNDVR